MDEYPNSKILKPGDQVLILDNASASWIKVSQVYTVKRTNYSGYLLFQEDKTDQYWACGGNEENQWFKLLGPNAESLLDQLDQLEQKLLKQSS